MAVPPFPSYRAAARRGLSAESSSSSHIIAKSSKKYKDNRTFSGVKNFPEFFCKRGLHFFQIRI